MKKVFGIGLITLLVMGMIFAGGNKDSVDHSTKKTKNTVAMLKLWGSQEDQKMLAEMVESFKGAHPEKEYNIDLGVVSEADSKARYLEDPAIAADVFAFANDQLKDFYAAGALYEIAGKFKEKVIRENGTGSIGAATLNNKLYAFPMSADNGYFMYYDKSVFSAKDIERLDTMLAVAQKAGKKVFMDVSNGWYIASFFLGAGGKLAINADGKQTCDFNNEKGVGAGEAIKAFTAHPAFLTGADAVLTGGIGTIIAAGVSGTWNANAIKEKLGKNYGAVKLPTFTLNGKQVQMSSFAGYKLVGISKLTAFPLEAMQLADWLTNEENQAKRFKIRGIGPSNKKVAASSAVKESPELSALSMQAAYAVSQNDVLGAYWTPAEGFGAAMEAKDYSKPIKAQLDSMVKQIMQ